MKLDIKRPSYTFIVFFLCNELYCKRSRYDLWVLNNPFSSLVPIYSRCPVCSPSVASGRTEFTLTCPTSSPSLDSPLWPSEAAAGGCHPVWGRVCVGATRRAGQGPGPEPPSPSAPQGWSPEPGNYSQTKDASQSVVIVATRDDGLFCVMCGEGPVVCNLSCRGLIPCGQCPEGQVIFGVFLKKPERKEKKNPDHLNKFPVYQRVISHPFNAPHHLI